MSNRIALTGLFLAGLISPATAARPAAAAPRPAMAPLRPCTVAKAEETFRCGTYFVPENRQRRRGRRIPLKLVIVPARSATPREPVFLLAGGPGQAATEQAPYYASSPLRNEHDLVFVDLRGTGEGNRLDCRVPGSDQDLQGYMKPIFGDTDWVLPCRAELEKRADLTRYSTTIAMQDLDEVRRALGYSKINLWGGSYGSRAGLIYLKMFGRNVRSAFLTGLVPVGNHAPLSHASAAQRAFDLTMAQCAAEPRCRSAYPRPQEDLAAIIAELRRGPARVHVKHPVSGKPAEVQLSASAFAEGVRVMLYSPESGRMLPLLLKRARAGDFEPFAQTWLEANRGLKRSLAMGLYLSVTCEEDTNRIRREQIPANIAGTFLGAERLRNQIAACARWPRAKVPAAYFRPFRSQVPVVLVSGLLDPVTPPALGEQARRSLPNSVHVVVPGAHVDDNDCLTSIQLRLFDTGSVRGLPTACALALRPPPFPIED